MGHWTERVLADLVGSLNERGIEVSGRPAGRPERLEAISLAGLVTACLRTGFTPVEGRLDLARTNRLPYRRVTQGSGVNQRADLADVVSWVSPLAQLERDGRSVAFFREGSPFLRSRDRPDLLAYAGSFAVEERSDPFAGDQVVVSWDGRRSGARRYRAETNTHGPILDEQEGDPLPPVLGMEVSLNKSCERLNEQVGLLREFGCANTAALLAHENPCPPGSLPPGVTVFTAADEAAFDSSMKQIGNSLLRGGRGG